MQVINIDLTKNPDIETFAKGREPGEPIALYGTIKSNGDGNLSVTINEVGDDKPDEDEEEGDTEEGDTAKPTKYGDMEDEMPTGTLT